MMGVVNGMSASFASGARAVGPTLAGWLFNVGEERGVSVFVWWVTAFVAFGGGVESFWMREGGGEGGGDEEDEDEAGSVTVVGEEDGTFSSEDESGFDMKRARKHEESVLLQEEVMLRGEVEGQTEGGLGGAPVGLGSTVLAAAGQIAGLRGVRTD